MQPPEHDDGPHPDADTTGGAAVRTMVIVRPDQGRSHCNATQNAAARQMAWSRLWDRLLAEPKRDAA